MIGRMKFEIDALVDEILDRLPKEVWTSSTTTFLDPAIGGGQFVRSIEARLRKAGHSDDSISQRVFGFEKGNLNIRYAVNKYGLVGQYSSVSYDELFEKGTDMKFDVVVGNPPYQKGKNHNFYVEFVKIAKSYSKNWIAFITPNRLFVKGHKLSNEIQEIKLTNIWWDVSNYNNWGIKTFVSAWIAQNKQHNTEEIVNDLGLVIRNGNDTICSNSEFDVNSISYNLLNKVYSKFPKIEFIKKKTGDHDFFIKRQ